MSSIIVIATFFLHCCFNYKQSKCKLEIMALFVIDLGASLIKVEKVFPTFLTFSPVEW